MMAVTALFLVDPGMKVNGKYCHDVLCSQQMYSAVKSVVIDMFIIQHDNLGPGP